MVAASAFLMCMSLESDNSEGEGNQAAADAYAAVTVRFFIVGDTIVLQGLRSCVELGVVFVLMRIANCRVTRSRQVDRVRFGNHFVSRNGDSVLLTTTDGRKVEV